MKKGSKKFRRFDEGGDVDIQTLEGADRAAEEAKRKGLSAERPYPVKNDVGLLARLMMGNIDDPTSQAYKQLGAGRARAAREAADAQLEAEAMRASARAPRMGMAAAAPAMDELEEANKRAPLDTTAGPRAPMPVAPVRPVARPPAPMAAPARPAVPRPAAPTRPAAPAGASVADLQAATRVAPPAPSADEAFEAKRRARLMTPGADALEGVYPEAYLGGAGGALRALLGMGKTAAAKAAPSAGAGAGLRAILGGAQKAATPVKEGVGAALKYGPKAGVEVAKSTAKGRAGRAEVQAKRAEGQRKSAEAMEEAKPILKARPGKAKPTSKTKYDEDNIEYRKGGKVKAFAKGGSVSSASSRGDGCAMRGKTRGRIY